MRDIPAGRRIWCSEMKETDQGWVCTNQEQQMEITSKEADESLEGTQNKEMLTLGRSYGTATFKGWAGEEKPAKATEKKRRLRNENSVKSQYSKGKTVFQTEGSAQQCQYFEAVK